MPGTNVVTTGLDHASVRSAVSQFAAMYGKEERIAEPNRETASVPVERIYELIDKDTCLLAVIHTSNVTGEIFDVAHHRPRGAQDQAGPVRHGGRRPVLAHPASWTSRTIGADAYVIAPYKNYGVKGCGYAHATDRLARAAALEVHLQA